MLDRAGLVGNPSALHTSGRAARADLEESREQVADLLGAHPSQVVFTSGGSESNSIAVLGSLAARPERPRSVVSAVEHPSVAQTRDRLAHRVSVVSVDAGGGLLVDHLDALLTPDVAVVSLMAVNNETGRRFDLRAAVDLAHARGARLHSDWVQAAGHSRLDFEASGLDLASVSAHKFGGPVGIGVLLIRRGSEPAPIGLGGGQEARIRSGTMTVQLAAGMAAALQAATDELDQAIGTLEELRERLVAGLTALPGVMINGTGPVSPHIVNATFDGVRADDLLLLLDRAGIDASTGSACTAGVHQPSEVLLAMGRTLQQAGSSLRFSLGWTTTSSDIQALLDCLPTAVDTARSARSA